MTPYERHLTRIALAVPSTPRGPRALQRAEDAQREAYLAAMQRDAERLELGRADAMAQREAR